ncbi:DUF6895 family protein [Streptomyces sp. NPDC057271]|uniref:DUF6895 family protein n=1 Tax=unclassified Streptomyces TaxID=2593676 RepID=UPI003636B204
MPSPLDQLSAGALDWVRGNLDHFDPYAASARSATHKQAKAALELALLCHCSERLDGTHDERLGGTHDERLGEATALVRKLWQHPDFPRLFETHPQVASSYALIFAALAPGGIDDTVCRAALARLTPDFLSPHGKSPLKRIEIRYFADKAGVRHQVEPYAELVPRSPLVTLHEAEPQNGPPLTNPQGYSLTHAAFYLGDYGRADPGLTGDALARARDLVCRMLGHCVEHDRWDLAAELVTTQFILGMDPLRTPSGAAAVECLLRAQRADGAIPARTAALRGAQTASAEEFFQKAYHPTLVTALMALIVSSARRS